MKRELPCGWEWKRLGELVEFFYGYPFDSTKFNEEKRGFPLIRIRNLIEGKTQTYYDGDFDNNYVIKNGDILIGMDGEFNIVRWAGGESLLNQRICKVEIKSNQLILGYAYRVLADILKKIEDRTPQVTVKHLSAKQLNSIDIPFPPLDTQRKIVGIIEKAEAIKKFRAQADELTNQLLQSVFLEMFGDPMKNPKGWEIKELETEIANIRYGTGSPPEYQERGIPFIRATNIKKGTIQKEGLVYISEDEAGKIPKCKVKTGDLILVRSGVNTGDCALVPHEYNGAYAAYDLILEISYPKNYYYNFLINSDYGKSIITPLTRRAGQPHINAEQVKSLQFQLPPTQLLEKFAQLVETVKTTRNNQGQSQQEIDTLFNALMQKAFTGELVA